ncbi:hypothetical protein DYB32_002990 [Aphanomyces invadans]|uniref:HID1 domain-containing protein n=1 Tax=Aphanomyces invadans TaxID=157072 RepID=A0A3R6W0A6_9STRA|nr:hypothetical protein DYB32_002990 [Aphanomyces invadans]
MGNSDSKSKFRESVYKLSNEEVASRHLEFWDKLWKIPTTAEEIFTLIQPDDIRMLRQNQQGNLSTMLTQAISQLHQIVETPLPKYYPQAVNCIRVSAGAYKAFREQLSTAPSSSANVVYPPLLWYNGVGYPDASAVASVQFDKNRKEVLKLLLTCFSSILYHTADSCDAYVDPFLAYATRKESRHAPTLFYSLVNVTLLYDPVGWGVPYAGSIVADERETLVDVSIQELLVLLWKLLDENKAFLQFTLKRADMNRIVVPLLFLMYEGRKEPSKVGMIHICTFILLLLSGERDFAVNLNKPFDLKLPLDLPPFNGNHADLLIVCLHKVIVNGYEKLNSVYNCFLTIVSNISPYIKKLNMVSSVRLLRLFKLFSQPRYLFDNDANHHLVFFLLDTFNNLIQYQYEGSVLAHAGNEQLVYAMVQNKDLFLKLSVLSMPISSTAVSVTPKAIPSKDSVDDVDVVPSVAALTALTDAPIDQDEAPPAPVQAKFTPTEEWLQGWKKKLPINTSLRLLQYLVPQVR